MFTEAGFNELSAAVARLNGCSVDLALGYVAFVGDLPELNLFEDGRLVIRDATGKVQARLIWPMDDQG